MKSISIPSTLALLLVGALFVLAMLTSGCTSSHELRGHHAYEKFNYTGAITQFEMVPEQEITREVRLRLADSYRRNNQPALAEQQYRLATYLPEDEHYHFAKVMMTNGNYADAQTIIQLNLQLNPQDADFQRLQVSNDSLSALHFVETSSLR